MVAHDVEHGVVVVTGIVIPSERDSHGNVVEVAVETEDFETYVIAPADSNEGLFELVDEKVRVSGKVSGKDINDNPILAVDAFEMIE
jgi:hypothetical protein